MIAFAYPASDASHIAESLTGRSYLSWSAISTHLRCPLKYQFHYLDQLPEEFVSANLVFGGAIHAALEAFFGEHLASRWSLNVDVEMARLGNVIATPSPSPKDAVPAPPLLLAESWNPETNPRGWWRSEKLDGVRADWDGKQFLSRNGNRYVAPE